MINPDAPLPNDRQLVATQSLLYRAGLDLRPYVANPGKKSDLRDYSVHCLNEAYIKATEASKAIAVARQAIALFLLQNGKDTASNRRAARVFLDTMFPSSIAQ